MCDSYDLQNDTYQEAAMLSIVVVGGSGDLAKKKIFPALFALYHQGLLPKHVQIVGYARSKASSEEFREKIMGTLSCRVDKGCAALVATICAERAQPRARAAAEVERALARRDECSDDMDAFLQDVTYFQGQYDEDESYEKLSEALAEKVRRWDVMLRV